MSEIFSRKPDPYDKTIPIELSRQLISTRLGSATLLAEYYDKGKQARVIAIPSVSEQVAAHHRLHEARVPVFSSMYEQDGTCLLVVPPGTRTIRQSLKFIARDVDNYSEIFHQLGIALRITSEEGLGMLGRMDGRSILDSVAFSLDDEPAYGGTLHLIPPYQFNQTSSLEDELMVIADELGESEYFSDYPQRLSQLLEATRQGYNDGNR